MISVNDQRVDNWVQVSQHTFFSALLQDPDQLERRVSVYVDVWHFTDTANREKTFVLWCENMEKEEAFDQIVFNSLQTS